MKRRLLWVALMLTGLAAAGPSVAADSLADLVKKAETAYYDADFRGARDWAGQALSRGLDTLPPDDFALLNIYSLLAAAAEKQGDLDVAEQRYADLVAVLETHTGGPDSLNTAFGLDPLAHILLRQGRVDEAERLFLRAIANRRIAIVDGNDPFAARHEANLAAVAAVRGEWDDALEGFDRAIQTMAAGDAAGFGNDDTLVDTRSPTNSWTFVGLAEAAWRLSNEGRHDPTALADRAFRVMQWNWRTSAAAALFEASLRAYADDPEKDRRQREIREIELALADVEEQLAALHEAEAAALSGTDAFQDFMDRADPAAQADAIAGVNDTLQTGAQMLALYESCNRVPPEQMEQCNLDILPQIEALQAQMMPDQETIDRLYAPLSPEEQAVEDQFGPERERLYEESGRLQNELRQAQAAFERDYGAPANARAASWSSPIRSASPRPRRFSVMTPRWLHFWSATTASMPGR